MTLEEMYDELARLVEEMRSYLDEHEDEEGNLSEEDAQTYDRMNQKVTALSKKIKRHESIAKVDNYLSQPASKPILDNPNAFGDGWNITASDKLIEKAKAIRATDEYRQAALTAMRTKFRRISNDLATSPDPSGGYLVPAEWDTRLIDTLQEENVMRTLGTSITTSGEHKINIAATKPAALWVAEGGAMTFGNGTFNQVSLDAHKVHVGILVTEELLADNAFNLENYIIDQFGRAIANAEEDAFINGTGTGQPTGFLTTIAADANAFTVTKGADISADDVVDLIYKLPRPYRKDAVFLTNDATLAKIRKFKDSTQNYIWSPSFVSGEPDRLLGYPVYTSAYMPAATSGNFALAFGDFSYYNIADRGVRSFQELRELYAGNGMVGYLMKERVDGILVDTSAIRALQIK